jgi:hypothetical protein
LLSRDVAISIDFNDMQWSDCHPGVTTKGRARRSAAAGKLSGHGAGVLVGVAMRHVIAVITLLIAASSSAAAAPVTLNFQGSWTFYDLPSETPDFYEAVGLHGITDGTPIEFSLTFDSSAPDSEPSPDHGVYYNAVLGGSFTAGSLSYAIGPGALELSRSDCGGGACPGEMHAFLPLLGPTLFGGGTAFPSNFVQFNQGFNTLLTSDSLGAALADSSVWSDMRLITGFGSTTFGRCPCYMGTSQLTPANIDVPEPSALIMMSGAFVGGFWTYARHRRRRATDTAA